MSKCSIYCILKLTSGFIAWQIMWAVGSGTGDGVVLGIARLKRDGTRTETRFGLSAKRTSPFKLAGASVQSTAGSRGVCISGSNGSNAGYTVF